MEWIVAAAHSSPFATNLDHPWDGDAIRQHLSPLFQAHGVDLVLTAHEHNYEGSHPILADGTPDSGGTVYVVSGGGGHGLSASCDPDVPAWSAKRGAW